VPRRFSTKTGESTGTAKGDYVVGSDPVFLRDYEYQTKGQRSDQCGLISPVIDVASDQLLCFALQESRCDLS